MADSANREDSLSNQPSGLKGVVTPNSQVREREDYQEELIDFAIKSREKYPELTFNSIEIESIIDGWASRDE